MSSDSNQNPPLEIVTTEDTSLHPSIPKPVVEATYLRTDNTDRYRVITHYFHQRYKLQQHRLKVRQVWEYVRNAYDPGYTVEMCERDLEALHQWGNLGREQDRETVGSVEEWNNRDYVYDITQWTVRFERMLEDARNDSGTRGSLDPTLIEFIRHNVETFNTTIEQLDASKAADPEFVSKKIRRPWETLYSQFEELTTSANDFHRELREAYKSDLADLDAFLIYKKVLHENLSGFINELVDARDPLRFYTARWRDTGLAARLVSLLAASKATTLAAPDDGALSAEFGRQVTAFISWFQHDGGLDALKRTTRNAIQTVIQLTARRIERGRLAGSRREQLTRLATTFARCETLDEAHLLGALTLGSPGARHVQGVGAWGGMSRTTSVWEQSPQGIPIRRIVRGRRPKPRPEPVANRRAARQALLEEEARKQAAEQEKWDQLFADGPISLTSLEVEDVEVRDRILEALDSCLMSPDGRGTSSDGSTIRLEPPAPGTPPGCLSAPDGDFLLPAFRMIREQTAREVA